jgi:hypothetical protein
MKQKKPLSALDREHVFGRKGNQARAFVKGNESAFQKVRAEKTLKLLFQVTKGNKIFAKTAISCNFEAFTFVVRRSSIYED